jgi:hypothetical protein
MLRVPLPQSLNLISQSGGVAGHWAAAAYLPELLRLEQRIFHGLAGHLWDKVGAGLAYWPGLLGWPAGVACWGGLLGWPAGVAYAVQHQLLGR